MSDNPVGRPRLYKSPEDFDAMVDLYVMTCKEEREPLTFTGMALFLGFSTREGIDEYLGYDGFSDSVKRAKAVVQQSYERCLYGANNSGARFALTNYGWKNASSVDVSSKDGSMTPQRSAIDPADLDDETLDKIMKARKRGSPSDK